MHDLHFKNFCSYLISTFTDVGFGHLRRWSLGQINLVIVVFDIVSSINAGAITREDDRSPKLWKLWVSVWLRYSKSRSG